MRKAITILFFYIFACITYANNKNIPLYLWYNKPATYFEESFPIGNGKLGALVYGGVNTDIIYLNDITFWDGKPVSKEEGKGKYIWIDKIREALFKEDYKLADSLQHHVQGEEAAFFMPLATLYLENTVEGKATNYYRELNLDSSLVKISYTLNNINYSREYFASNPDHLIAVHLKANKPGAITTRIMLTSQVPHHVKAKGNQLTMLGHAVGDEKETTHTCTMLRVQTTGGKTEAADSSIYLTNADEAIIYIVNQTSFNGFDKHPVKEAAPYLERASDDIWHTHNYSYEEFKNHHISDYRKYFSRMNLNLKGQKVNLKFPTDSLLLAYTDNYEQVLKSGEAAYLENLYFQFGRYLLISCSRTPSVPANLQGLWTPHLWSPWRSDYTMNINIEENYWPTEVANLSEMAEPLLGFVQGLAVNGKYTAQNFYGINQGWCAAHNSDIWCKTAPVGGGKDSPMWANWNLGGAWLVNSLWEHYQFTKDKNYLKEIYPLIKGASDFVVGLLIKNPNHPEELITAPCTSPENHYVNDKGYHGTTCYGGTADLAIIKELLLSHISAHKALYPSDKLFETKMKSIYKKLHPYTIGHMGDLNEWYFDWDDYDFQHRHQSHLIGLFPGYNLIMEDCTGSNKGLQQAARRTLEIKGDMSTGWSTGWRINLWARLGDGNHAYKILRNLLTYVSPDNYKGPLTRRSGGTYPNLFDAHPPFQIDGNFGGTAGICEMLVQSHMNEISLLPALPDTWRDGEVKGICARGGYVIDMKWKKGKVTKAKIHSRVANKATIRYNGKTISLNLNKDQDYILK